MNVKNLKLPDGELPGSPFMSSPRFFRIMSLVAMLSLATFAVPTAARCDDTGDESRLLAVLAGESAESDKAIACKQLAVHGSSAAVPALAKLLSNERLASWARIALEAIPGKESDAALRDAAANLSGRLAVGAINSIGVRRDAAAVQLLSKRLNDEDGAVTAAAAAALGKIGDSAAAEALQAAFSDGRPSVRPAAAEACVVCAERLLADGAADKAVAIYDLVRTKSVQPQRIVEATRGAILARGSAGIAILLEQLRSNDQELFNIGLTTARELPGEDVDRALAEELRRAAPSQAGLLIEAMADRGSPLARPVILEAVTSGEKGVRLTAIRATGRIGDTGSLAPLLAVASDPDPDLSAAAVAAIAGLRGEGVDEEIRRRLAAAEGRLQVMLLELVGRRRIDAVPQVLESVASRDAGVRLAALMALGEVVDLDRMGELVQLAVKPRDPADGQPAMKALRTAAVRMPDRDRCAEKIVAAMEAAPADVKPALLDIVGAVAGPRALEAVAAAAKGSDEAMQDAATRLLGDWLTPDAGPVLLELAKSLPDGKFRSRAFKGYLRVARQFGGSPDEKAAMCRTAYESARDVEDRKFVVDALKSIPAKGSLELAAEAGATEELRESARAAATAILAKAGDAIPGAWDIAAKLDLKKGELPAAPK